eukprot:TRINITY_DN2399_c0_g1_i3.p1 TRINITY_DN2399_c0_g1~~TRINITY_DN2399_c0_g1_i3.p1  ORF type:complete len:457 (+),score=84.76 TRINITY_DN2399_c0_g1_i3:94-1464(+)
MGNSSAKQQQSSTPVLDALREHGEKFADHFTIVQVNEAYQTERGPHGEGLIHEAALHDDQSLEVLLLRLDNINVNKADNDGHPPLWYAMKARNESNFSTLVRYGAHFSTTPLPPQTAPYNKDEIAQEVKGQPYNYEKLEIPLDEEGYVFSFPHDHPPSEIKQFFDRHGVVVIRDVITPEDADATVDEVWTHLERSHPELKRNEPWTWNNWASLARIGILGNMPILYPQCVRNRQSPRVYDAFRSVFGKEDLIMSCERIGMMRPTRNVRVKQNEEPRDVPEWKTLSEWLHWDMNPWTGLNSTAFFGPGQYAENNAHKILKTQGILALVDCRSDDGGFHTVPGFNRHLAGWANNNMDVKPTSETPLQTSYQVPEADPMRHDIQRMPIRKGSLLIWDSRMPHGSFPNDSERFRVVQYMKMADAQDPAFLPWAVDGILPSQDEGFTLSNLGAKLFGLEKW